MYNLVQNVFEREVSAMIKFHYVKLHATAVVSLIDYIAVVYNRYI